MEGVSRRAFLARSSTGAAGAWLAASLPAIAAAQEHAHHAAHSPTPVKFEFLTAEQAAEVGALVEQMIPTDDSPGARDVGVVYFIDRALVSFDKDKQEAYTAGLKEVAAKVGELFPGKTSFAALAPVEQQKVMRAIESTRFFGLLRFHTCMGFFGLPEYGGNRGLAGWKLIEMDAAHSFEPPFGHYDREAEIESKDQSPKTED